MKKRKFLKQLLALVSFAILSTTSISYAQQGINQHIPTSPRQTIDRGIYWPNGQVLPHFATPATQLDGFDLKQGKLQPEEKIMLLSL